MGGGRGHGPQGKWDGCTQLSGQLAQLDHLLALIVMYNVITEQN